MWPDIACPAARMIPDLSWFSSHNVPLSASATKTGGVCDALEIFRLAAFIMGSFLAKTNPEPAPWPTGPPVDLLLGAAESE